MEGHVTAQLYADWHTPAKSWTWGDGRIFVTGTEGFAELRLTGDPFVDKAPLFMSTTHAKESERVTLIEPPHTITGDFLQRIAAQPSLLSGEDILIATEATIAADEQVTKIRV